MSDDHPVTKNGASEPRLVRRPPPAAAERPAGAVERPVERHVLAAVLKTPTGFARQIGNDEELLSRGLQLLLWGLLFHALYGFAMAMFGGAGVALVAAVKAPLIALCAAALCLPSLYVFACIGGMPVRLSQSFAMGAAAVAVTGLLLLGMTPVAWLFAVSTDSLPFVVMLNVLAWLIAVGFAFRFFGHLRAVPALGRPAGVRWWLVIYIVVSLQMVTAMRPLLGPHKAGWFAGGKKFFLVHFAESFERAR